MPVQPSIRTAQGMNRTHTWVDEGADAGLTSPSSMSPTARNGLRWHFLCSRLVVWKGKIRGLLGKSKVYLSGQVSRELNVLF